MAALCLDASLEILQPLSYRRMLSLQGDLCHCLHKWYQAVVTLSTHPVLQNSPQFIVEGFEVFTPRKPILGIDEGPKVPPQPLLSCLGVLSRDWVLLEDPFLTTEEAYVKMFHISL